MTNSLSGTCPLFCLNLRCIHPNNCVQFTREKRKKKIRVYVVGFFFQKDDHQTKKNVIIMILPSSWEDFLRWRVLRITLFLIVLRRFQEGWKHGDGNKFRFWFALGTKCVNCTHRGPRSVSGSRSLN